MKIHKNISIPNQDKQKMTGITQQLVKLIVSDEMKIGDMVEMPVDCSNVRQKLYDTGHTIAVRYNRTKNCYSVWRTK